MKGLCDVLNLLKIKGQLNELEKDALLSELMASYASGEPCYLMKFLMSGDFEGFQKYVLYMHEKGLSIRECIQINLALLKENNENNP